MHPCGAPARIAPLLVPYDLLLIAPYSGGHHGEHVRWILQAGRDRGLSLALAGSPALIEDLVGGFAWATDGVDVVPLESTTRLVSARPGWRSLRATGAVLTEAVDRAPAPRALITYLDHAVVPLAAGLRFRAPVRLSGILFRPPFLDAEPTSGRVRRTLKQAALRLAGANPHLETVFTLDPNAPRALARLGIQARFLPDPVELVPATESADRVRASYGVEPSRKLAILFGSLEERKGLFALADALHLLPEATARRLSIVIAGRTYDSVRPRLMAALDLVRRETSVQVCFREGFITNPALADLTAAADLVLAPYIDHVGSSGVVVRAAAAGTPLIAQEGGQIGREVRTYRLGQTIEPSDAVRFAAALANAVEDPTVGFDRTSAEAYANAHSVSHFTDNLYSTLLDPPNLS